jgi:hypothetical protein|tara:strand:+ start:2851 stop:3060 length:210 start_codon:yes stop_codon:yes gene_type:complete
MAIVQDKRTELSENFTCNTIDEVHAVLQEFVDDRADEVDWDLQVQFLKDSKLWLVVARASVIEADIQYG